MRYEEVLKHHSEELKKLRAEGKTLKEIAMLFNCKQIMKKGLPGFERNPRKYKVEEGEKILKERKEDILKWRREGLSWKEIFADKLKQPCLTKRANFSTSQIYREIREEAEKMEREMRLGKEREAKEKLENLLIENKEWIIEWRIEGKVWENIFEELGASDLAKKINWREFPIYEEIEREAKKRKESQKVLKGILTRDRHLDLTKLLDKYRKELPPPLGLEGDWIIASDWHIPFVDIELYSLLFDLAKRERIENILIAGDFFDFGHLKTNWLLERTIEVTTVDQEFEIAKEILKELNEHFKQIVIFGGNHDLWLIKKLEGEISLPTVFKMLLDTAITTPYRYVTISSGGEDWRVSHPKGYRKLNLTAPRELTTIHPNQNIIIAHFHRFSFGIAPNGSSFIVELPAISEVSRLVYTQLDDNFYPRQVSGFGYLKEGIIRIILKRGGKIIEF